MQKKSAKEPFKSQKSIWLLWVFFFSRTSHLWDLVQSTVFSPGHLARRHSHSGAGGVRKKNSLGFFSEKSPSGKSCVCLSMYTWGWGGDLTSLTRVNLQCSAGCNGATAICSKRFVLYILNTTQNDPVLSDFSELRKTTPAYVQSRAFTLQRQVTDKTSSKNIHLQGCLAKPCSQTRRKNALPFSHPTLSLYTAFTDQNPPWCSTIELSSHTTPNINGCTNSEQRMMITYHKILLFLPEDC